eukprot:Hpha_TRINITY_DN14462_c0_g1::TRINITY_DN14462_c0_g1_i1::g.158058::m.158058
MLLDPANVEEAELCARVRDALLTRYGRLRDAFHHMNDGLSSSLSGVEIAICPYCGASQAADWEGTEEQRRMKCRKCGDTNSKWKEPPSTGLKDSILDIGELKRGLSAVGISEEDCERLANILDRNGDGGVSQREFSTLLDADTVVSIQVPEASKAGAAKKVSIFGEFSGPTALPNQGLAPTSRGSTGGGRRMTAKTLTALEGREKRKSFFKRHQKSLWEKVRKMDFMLHTTGNELTLEAMEGDLETQSLWKGTDATVKEMLLQAKRVDDLMESLGVGLEYQPGARFDEWNIMRECACETSPAMIDADETDGASPCEVPDAKDTPVPLKYTVGSTPAEAAAALSELSRLRAALEEAGLRGHETGHVPKALCDQIDEVRQLNPSKWGKAQSDEQHRAMRDLEDADHLFERSVLETQRRELWTGERIRPQSAPARRSTDPRALRRLQLPHNDSLWSWEHRYQSKAAVRELRMNAGPDSTENIALLRCNLAQEAVTATAAKFQSYMEGLSKMTETASRHRTEQEALVHHLDKSSRYRDHLARRCDRDIKKIADTLDQHERENADRGERAARRRIAAIERLRANSDEMEKCLDRVRELLVDRAKEVRMRVEAAHQDVKREGQMALFRGYANKHMNRLREFADRSRVYLDNYTAQKAHLTALSASHAREFRKKEEKLGALVTECHAEHVAHLYAYRQRIEACCEQQQRKINKMTGIDAELEVDQAFCEETQDDPRAAAVLEDIIFLQRSRDSAERILETASQRVTDIQRQGQWSLEALDAVGAEPPVEPYLLVRAANPALVTAPGRAPPSPLLRKRTGWESPGRGSPVKYLEEGPNRASPTTTDGPVHASPVTAGGTSQASLVMAEGPSQASQIADEETRQLAAELDAIAQGEDSGGMCPSDLESIRAIGAPVRVVAAAHSPLKPA